MWQKQSKTEINTLKDTYILTAKMYCNVLLFILVSDRSSRDFQEVLHKTFAEDLCAYNNSRTA